MKNNFTYEVVRKEMQKKIINYLHQNSMINIREYEVLISKIDKKINDLNDKIDKNKNQYVYQLSLDILI